MQSYLIGNDKKAADLISKHLKHLTDPNVAVRRGSALALGVLPHELLIAKWNDVLLKLCSACKIEVKKTTCEFSNQSPNLQKPV